MFKNYFQFAIRNLRNNKVHSIINIAGLLVGMTVALLIGLWIWDELTFDRFPVHYDRIAQVRQSQTFNGEIKTGKVVPRPPGRRAAGELWQRFPVYRIIVLELESYISCWRKAAVPDR
jgi:hypothetical protein